MITYKDKMINNDHLHKKDIAEIIERYQYSTLKKANDFNDVSIFDVIETSQDSEDHIMAVLYIDFAMKIMDHIEQHSMKEKAYFILIADLFNALYYKHISKVNNAQLFNILNDKIMDYNQHLYHFRSSNNDDEKLYQYIKYNKLRMQFIDTLSIDQEIFNRYLSESYKN